MPTGTAGGPPVLLVKSGGAKALPEWQSAFASVLPEIEVHGWDDPGIDPARVAFALVWEPEPGRLAGYPNLQVVFSTAAGVDHITRDPHLPRHVPIIRMGADEMAQTVGEYVCLGALTMLRDLPRILSAQHEARWDHFESGRTARTTRVGILGLGRIGQVAAGMLTGIGFPVHGWVRSPRPEGSVRCFAGLEQLDDFLGCTDILVALLPETPETRGLVDAPRLAALPRGAGIVNAGRGTLIVMPDLLAALDDGHLSLAMLDVFAAEPLPPTDPVWRHDRVIVSAHLAGFASRRSRAQSVAHDMARLIAGKQLVNLYDPARNY